MARNLQQIRNIGIVAHIDAGKTTVTERMLHYCGATHKMGEVDKGTTVTDFDVEEQHRGITIRAACVTLRWKDTIINLIDTPGHVDFTAEVERSLRVLDGAVVVFSAREGVEAQSETVWRQADKYNVPRLAFINKMDREGADFDAVLEEMRTRLGAKPVVVALPVGAGPSHAPDGFRGTVDLLTMKLLTFTDESRGAEVLEQEIPPQFAEEAELWRNQMLEQLFDFDDELAEIHLAESPVPEPLIRRVLRDATLEHLIVPVLCGSALHFAGIQPLLDAIGHYLPSPADVPPVEGINPRGRKGEVRERRKADPQEPFCGLVFKVESDRHGDLHFLRVYSGQLKAGARVYVPGKDKRDNARQLWHIQADRREQVDVVEAGDIVGIVGLHHAVTGDTLCHPQHPIVLEEIVFPETVISMAIEPESAVDRKKLTETLEIMKRQDPTFRAREDEETGQTIISGMGELHLEIIKNRLLRDFNLNVRVHRPRVSYRETVEQVVEATGLCQRQQAGQALFAEVAVRLEPHVSDDRPVTVEHSPQAAKQIPQEFLSAVLEVLREQAEGGGSLGFPLINVRFNVLAGKAHETESNEVAFRLAAADAFRKALSGARIVLLEPIMRLEVSLPEEHLGEFVADLQQRRGVISRTHTRVGDAVIEAEAPLANLFGYADAMRSMSQGRATCSMEPSVYGPAPPEVLKKFL